MLTDGRLKFGRKGNVEKGNGKVSGVKWSHHLGALGDPQERMHHLY